MKSAVFRGREKLRPRRPLEEKPIEGKKESSRAPYFLAALAALLILPFFLGISGGPEGRSTVIIENKGGEIGSVKPQPASVLSAQGLSCKPAAELVRDLSGFVFDTNSTIDSFSIDRNSKVVTVGVRGPDGSAGIFCINIPKSFIPTNELKTTIDNIPVNPSIEEFSNANVVSLAYHHSERVLTISGVSLREPELNTATNNTNQTSTGG